MLNPSLNKYIAQVQRFARDQRQQYFDIGDLTDYINEARREVAMRTSCIRVKPPIAGGIASWVVTNGGSNYSSFPTCVVTAPDFPSGGSILPLGKQATAVAIVSNGVIEEIENTYGGAGYFSPQMTITDPTGSGATVTPVMQPLNLLHQGQEEYPFTNVDLSQFPGVSQIHFVRSVAIIYANYRYILPQYAWTVYQGMIRQFPYQFSYVPTFCSQFGQGSTGSMFFYPLPSQTYQMEWDCSCTPSDLTDNQSVEALPPNWTDAVPYYAAKMAFEELQNLNAAKYYEDQFDRRTLGYSRAARTGKMTNLYGRY